MLFVRNKLEKVAMSFEKLIKKSKTMKLLDSLKIVNPFVPNAPFLYPQSFFNHKFQGVEKGCIGNKWVNLRLNVGVCFT